MVHDSNKHIGTKANDHSTITEHADTSKLSKRSTCAMEEVKANDMPGVRETYIKQGISNQTINILLHSWRKSTKSQYRPSLEKWFNYCKNIKVDPNNPSIVVALDFLTNL